MKSVCVNTNLDNVDFKNNCAHQNKNNNTVSALEHPPPYFKNTASDSKLSALSSSSEILCLHSNSLVSSFRNGTRMHKKTINLHPLLLFRPICALIKMLTNFRPVLSFYTPRGVEMHSEMNKPNDLG